MWFEVIEKAKKEMLLAEFKKSIHQLYTYQSLLRSVRLVLQGWSRVDAAATQSQKIRLRSGQALPWSKQEGHKLDLDQSWTKRKIAGNAQT